ncbi:hypothetical protein SAMN04490182_1350 [Pseudomonas cedrina]|uniref:Pectate lyase domain-containing protein n=2 Tax=Pseudomonas cedrina TaxID=651740 RepID=A0A1V2JZA3_PSECE|nr:hypothetical protein [Pseudomonas cedrina]ONH50709.1 hypothetical protein BLL36_25040 [Pseudomonas cedrina subsp. cedrina]SDS35572.1 hypothetical protein SAMN04490182_1350 [Pseudomonas cedrina]
MSCPESKLTGLTGFAKAAKVTGGLSAPVVTINTLDQLKSNMADITPRVLLINSHLSASSLTTVNKGANNTLLFRQPQVRPELWSNSISNCINNFHLGFTFAQNANSLTENNYFGEGGQHNGRLDDKGTGAFSDSSSVSSITHPKSPKARWTAASNYGDSLKTAAQAKDFTQKNTEVQSLGLMFGS